MILQKFWWSGLLVVKGGMRFCWHTLFSTFVLQLLMTFAAANPEIHDCESLLDTPLSPRQIEVLEAAAASRYQVRLFTGEVGGRTKTVVLLGEYHIKGSVEGELGLDVINEFNFRGLEGVLSADRVSRFYAFYHLKMLRGIGRIFSRQKDHGSTIDKAYFHGEESEHEAYGVANSPKLDLLLGPNFEGRDCNPERTINVLLEVGHKPSFAEKVRMLTDPLLLVAAVTNFCQATVKFATGEELIDPLLLGGTTFVVLSAFWFQHFGAKALKGFEEKRWYQSLFALNFGHLNGRNRTMVTNLMKAFERYPNRDLILVLVGKGHIVGMRQLLQKEGFVEQSLPFNEVR